MGLRDWVLSLFIRIDIRQGKKDLRALTKETKKQQSIWNRVRNTIMREQSKTMRSVHALVIGVSSVLSAIGMTLDPVTQTSINILSQGLASVVQYQALTTAGTGGASAPISIALVAAAFGVYAVSEIMILQGAEESARLMKGAEAGMQAMESITSIWRI